MDTNQIMSAVFLIAVLILILPNFLSTNNKLKEFLKSPVSSWVHIDTFAWSSGSILSTKGAALQGLDIMIDFLENNYQ